MKLDSIFRIYSMTKPIVSTTLMQLVEEGRLQISDPVSKYLPEIGNMKVGTEVTGPDGRPVLHLSDPDAADDGAGPAAPHLGPDLRRPRHVAGQRSPTSMPRSAIAATTNEEFVTKLSKLAAASSTRATAGNTASRSTCRAA